MKKFLLNLFTLALCVGTLAAQTPDTTRFNLGGKEIIIIEKEDKKGTKDDMDMPEPPEAPEAPEALEPLDMKDAPVKKENSSPNKKSKSNKGAKVGFLDMDLGLSFLIHDGSSDGLKEDLKLRTWKSNAVTFNWLPTDIYLGSRHVMLKTAFGWYVNTLSFKNNIVLEPNKELVYSKPANIKFSKLHQRYLQIPLEIYVKSKKIKGLGTMGIGAGGYAGILVNENTFVKRSDIDQITKTKEDFGSSRYRYGLTGRVDLGRIKFYANYDLSETFEDTNAAGAKLKGINTGIWFDL